MKTYKTEPVFIINGTPAKKYINTHKKDYSNCDALEWVMYGIHFPKGNKNTNISKFYIDIHGKIYCTGARATWELVEVTK